MIKISIIIPTRERADYLGDSIRSCISNINNEFEIVVLDNASQDNTYDVVNQIKDKRIKYHRNEVRLSMRDNFEKGYSLSCGEIICFIGDDDAIFSDTIDRVIRIFNAEKIDAISGSRASYFWPDLDSPSKSTGLIPRGHGYSVLNSRNELNNLLSHGDYYRLPCVYHGFVRRSIIDNILNIKGRFFLSSQVDIYSAIALAYKDIQYVYSKDPLIINGGSSRSNGASHNGGGSRVEKNLWKKEDDIGFLNGYDKSINVPTLIIESAIRYGDNFENINLENIFNKKDIERVMLHEYYARLKKTGDSIYAKSHYGITEIKEPKGGYIFIYNLFNKIYKYYNSLLRFYNFKPIDMRKYSINNIFEASKIMQYQISNNKLHIYNGFIGQIKASLRIIGINK